MSVIWESMEPFRIVPPLPTFDAPCITVQLVIATCQLVATFNTIDNQTLWENPPQLPFQRLSWCIDYRNIQPRLGSSSAYFHLLCANLFQPGIRMGWWHEQTEPCGSVSWKLTYDRCDHMAIEVSYMNGWAMLIGPNGENSLISNQSTYRIDARGLRQNVTHWKVVRFPWSNCADVVIPVDASSPDCLVDDHVDDNDDSRSITPESDPIWLGAVAWSFYVLCSSLLTDNVNRSKGCGRWIPWDVLLALLAIRAALGIGLTATAIGFQIGIGCKWFLKGVYLFYCVFTKTGRETYELSMGTVSRWKRLEIDLLCCFIWWLVVLF